MLLTQVKGLSEAAVRYLLALGTSHDGSASIELKAITKRLQRSPEELCITTLSYRLLQDRFTRYSFGVSQHFSVKRLLRVFKVLTLQFISCSRSLLCYEAASKKVGKTGEDFVFLL